MSAEGPLTVGVVYALSTQQIWQPVDVDAGMTVQEAIDRSGLLEKFPEIDLTIQKVGVFGKVVNLDDEVKNGDRIEIYRPITADPKAVKRKKAAPPKKATAKKQTKPAPAE